VLCSRRLGPLQPKDQFVAEAQRHARLSWDLPCPKRILETAWVSQLDIARLPCFAWCVLKPTNGFSETFFSRRPARDLPRGPPRPLKAFNAFLLSSGFHLVDVTPCADGASPPRSVYALRLRSVRAFAGPMPGAMFSMSKDTGIAG